MNNIYIQKLLRMKH